MISYELPPNWLRDQLRQRGVPQRDVADALDIDPPAASRLIGGKRRLKFEELPKLMTLLVGESPEWRLKPDLPANRQVRGRLEEVLKVARMDPATFAALSGQPMDAVLSALEDGGPVKDGALAEAAANLLGIAQGYLQMSGGPANTPDVLYKMAERWGNISRSETPPAPQPETLEVLEVPGLVPIYAPPVPLGNGTYDFAETVAETRAMPLLDRVPGAWGMFVGEGGAGPRFSSGDVLYVHPNRPVRHGDFAIARSAGKLIMGTVISDSKGTRLVDGNSSAIRKLRGARLEKVVLATFD